MLDFWSSARALPACSCPHAISPNRAVGALLTLKTSKHAAFNRSDQSPKTQLNPSTSHTDKFKLYIECSLGLSGTLRSVPNTIGRQRPVVKCIKTLELVGLRNAAQATTENLLGNTKKKKYIDSILVKIL